jgi:tRNA pseudouridine38-40 synthase
MKRYQFHLSYNGTNFCGWQKQPNAHSVQAEIEQAIFKLYSRQEIPVIGCGRTDTGVHAKHYVLHVDLPFCEDTEKLIFKLNRILPASISIEKIIETHPDFHARFDASQRTYRYFISCKKDPFHQDTIVHYPSVLDLKKMNQAAAVLIGKKDFTSFSKLHTDVNNNICEVYSAQWVNQGNGSIYFEISANRFLRNMVRAIVGTLLDVGTGKLKQEDILSILDQKDRGAASLSVPAHGLFLWEIKYE